jgi:phosphoglycerol transferase
MGVGGRVEGRTLAGECLVVAGIAVAIAAVVLSLWRARWGEPFNYGGDAPYYALLVRTIGRYGTYLTNPHLGWPFGLNLADYPEGGDNAHWVTLAGLQALTGSAITAINVFYVATFATAAASAHLALRILGIRRLTAVAAGLLFAFAPYHFARNESHLMLSSYAIVPVAVVLAVAVLHDHRLVLAPDRMRIAWRAPRTWAAFAAIVVMASSGSYYFVFGVMLISLAAVTRAITGRTLRPALTAAILVGLGLTTYVLNLLPSIIGRLVNGPNPAVATRSAVETELYGLRVAELFLPRDAHRVDALAALARRSHIHTALPSEAGQQLGLVGAVGLVILLTVLVARVVGITPRAGDAGGRLLSALSLFAGFCVLVGAIGSLSYLASAAGLRPIRAWNRISIVIEFCALAAVAVVIDRLASRAPGRPHLFRRAGILLPIAVLAVGLFDQTSPTDQPSYATIHQEFTSDRDFFQAVANALPAGTAVFELPYVPFPEGSRAGVGTYDQGRGFQFQPQLAWSYGFMAGRHPAYAAALERQPPEQWLAAVAAIGFRGIVVDNNGYAAGASNPCNDLTLLIHSRGVVSRDRRYTFFDLRAYAAQRATSPGELAAEAARALKGA